MYCNKKWMMVLQHSSATLARYNLFNAIVETQSYAVIPLLISVFFFIDP